MTIHFVNVLISIIIYIHHYVFSLYRLDFSILSSPNADEYTENKEKDSFLLQRREYLRTSDIST